MSVCVCARERERERERESAVTGAQILQVVVLQQRARLQHRAGFRLSKDEAWRVISIVLEAGVLRLRARGPHLS